MLVAVLTFTLGAHLRGARFVPRLAANAPRAAGANGGFGRAEAIGVIGGGVSGLWAAIELTRLGYTDVTVLEAGAELGGKARSFELDGRSYPLGAVMTPFGLRENSFAAAQVLERPFKFLAQLATYSRTRLQLLPANALLSTTDGQASGPLRPNPFALGGESGVEPAARAWRDAFEPQGTPERFYAHTLDFDRTHAPLASPAGVDRLAHWGDAQRDWPLVFTSSHGYGLLDGDATPPLYYWVRFAQKATNCARLGFWWRHGAGLPGGPTGPALRGFEHNAHFARAAAEAGDALRVRTGARVLAVQRPARDAPARPRSVKVRTTAGDFAFDRLIVATDLKLALTFLDVAEESAEAALFAQIRHLTYYTVVVRARVPALTPGRVHYVSGHQTSERLCAPTIMLVPYADSDVLISWAYGAPPQEADGASALTAEQDAERAARERVQLEAQAREAVERLGGTFGRVELVERYAHYFPHVNADSLRAGFHRRVDALQGERNTYYVGEVLNLPLVSECIDFARYIVRRCFAPVPAVASARAEAAAPEMMRALSATTLG